MIEDPFLALTVGGICRTGHRPGGRDLDPLHHQRKALDRGFPERDKGSGSSTVTVSMKLHFGHSNVRFSL
jgi:hypothetical protein